MSAPQTRRCAIYTRKSSEEGLEQSFNSLHAQYEACQAFIRSQAHEGWRLIKTTYDDGGFSGGSLERPALQRLLTDIEKKLIDIIVVYKVDRLTRSLTDFAKIVEVLDKRGVSFVSVTQQFNTTTSMGRLTLNVLLSFAQFEREVTGERIRDKIAASKKKGLWMGGTPPLGYDVKERKLVVNETEAELVRTIFGIYVELGCVSALAKALDARAIRSKRWTSQKGIVRGGGPFGRGALYALLKNQIYLGRAVHKGTTYPGDHAAIVPQALWDKVQSILAGHRHERRLRGVQKNGHLLTGLIFDVHGNRMSPSRVRNRHGRIYAYYASQPLVNNRAVDRDIVMRMPAGELETLVVDRVRAVLNTSAQRTWDKLTPVDRAERLRSLVRRAVIAPEAITINVVRDDDLRLPEAASRGGEIVGGADGDDTITIRIPIRLRSRGGERIIETDDGGSTVGSIRPDRALVKALVRALAWRDALEQGKASSTVELAAHVGCHVRYVRNLLKLAFLAPDLIERILVGQPTRVKLADLIASELALSWQEQCSAIVDALNRAGAAHKALA